MDEFSERKHTVLAPLFFEAGAALYDSQTFEQALGYLLFLLSRLGAREAQTGELFNQQRAIAILENDERATAGEILGRVRKFVRLSDGINKRLTDALRARNAIVHRFFTDNVERMVDVRERKS